MKTTITTKTAGTITINSEYFGTKTASWGENVRPNYNNHLVTVSHNGKRYSFDFWGSIMNPEIANDQENIFAFYCSLSDAILAIEGFEEFCNNLGYNPDSKKDEKTFKACEKTLRKVERVFSCDIYDLINEIQEKYNC